MAVQLGMQLKMKLGGSLNEDRLEEIVLWQIKWFKPTKQTPNRRRYRYYYRPKSHSRSDPSNLPTTPFANSGVRFALLDSSGVYNPYVFGEDRGQHS